MSCKAVVYDMNACMGACVRTHTDLIKTKKTYAEPPLTTKTTEPEQHSLSMHKGSPDCHKPTYCESLGKASCGRSIEHLKNSDSLSKLCRFLLFQFKLCHEGEFLVYLQHVIHLCELLLDLFCDSADARLGLAAHLDRHITEKRLLTFIGFHFRPA